MTVSYAGSGLLVIEGEATACLYRLEVRDDPRMRSGAGHVSTSAAALWAGCNSEACRLVLDDGRSVPVVIIGGFNGRTAAFEVCGPVSDSAPGGTDRSAPPDR